jgi:Ca2+-binding RTX toxin-like protein
MTGYASIHGTDHDDLIDTTHKGHRDDFINAKDGNDTIKSGDGNDTIYAGSGKDLVYAGSDHDKVYGEAAQDTIYGGSGNDLIDGGNSNDWLYGDSGHDTLIGGQGSDFISGGTGNDLLTGDGSGGSSQSDTFYFENNFGDDVITDFNLGNDVLEIKAGINGTSIASPSDLAPYVGEVSGNAVISFANGDSITLQGVSKADLLSDLNDVVNIV